VSGFKQHKSSDSYIMSCNIKSHFLSGLFRCSKVNKYPNFSLSDVTNSSALFTPLQVHVIICPGFSFFLKKYGPYDI
jgi:hypothetical protein